jgi:hypothetical protein
MIEKLSEAMLRAAYRYTSGRTAYEVQQIMTIARIYDRAIVMIMYHHEKGLISTEAAQEAIDELYRRADRMMADRSRNNA